MQILSLLWGVLAAIAAIIAFFPCLGALNWLVIPFAGLGAVFGMVALATARPEAPKAGGVTGFVLASLATLVGILRLFLGGGVV